MSVLLYYAIVFVSGLVLGPFMLKAAGNILPAGAGARVGKWFAHSGLRMGEAWTANETQGGRYELKHLSESDESDELLEDGEGNEWEDIGLMGHLDAGGKAVPFGTTYDESRVISSPLVSKIGEQYGELRADGGVEDIEGAQDEHVFDEDRSINWYRENAFLGRARDGNHIVEVVNGAAEIPTQAVADVKETARVLAYGGDPEQPKRAANNAENAERERQGDKGIMGHVGRLGYVFLGGILVYLGTSQTGGGGGGGGGAADNVPAMVAPQLVDVSHYALTLMGVA